ncbi:sigma-70 family RNA polymerase sigma factor [Enterocloster asparagiformis]|uniref:sigma-70 family RNA polymerase sigma factor n=1 Tax=Enterocloster asparagiformis TaxID=333367 RepID=UPI0034C06EE3
MTNEQLVARIRAGENVGENMAQLYEQVKRFIHAVAWRYRDSGMVEDLEQEGFLALYDAVDGYDEAQGVRFLTYAEYWIRQRISRYLQANGSSLRLPVHCREKLLRYKRLCSSFQLEHGREPSEREIARMMGLTLEQVREIRGNACMARVGSLDAPMKGLDGGEDTTVGDLVAAPADPTGEAVDRVQSAQLCAILWECVDSLPGQQPAVIRQRYQSGMSLREIGEAQGTTAEAVRQIHAKALRELRASRFSKRLRPFLPEAEQIYSLGLRGNGVGKFNRTWTSSTEKAALWLEEQEERRRQHLELLERVRQAVAISQQTEAVQ